MSAVVTFIGYHDSGKTTLVSQVVGHLKGMGYRVAVIKSSNEKGVLFDREGTDTYTHRLAGADSVLFVGPDQMVLQTGSSDHSIVTLAHRYFPDADIVTTDVWTSMGFEAENAERARAFENWQVDAAKMAVAADDALFMHCLPAHRGEEVSADVIDGEQSVVWDEAENRLHTQKALMEFLLLNRVND